MEALQAKKRESVEHAAPLAPDQPMTVVVHRRIKPGFEEAFEAAMREFIQFTLGFPGHREIHILRPSGESPLDYTVVDKFADPHARESFKASPEYKQWMQRLAGLTEGDASIEEMGGLAGWFTLPEQPAAKPPPKPKMAIVTFLGVFPVALLFSLLFKPLNEIWPPLIVSALFNACIVASLTWVVMPLLTRLLKRWLFPNLFERNRAGASALIRNK